MNVFPVKTGILFCVLVLLLSLLGSSLFANDLNTGGQLGVVRTLSASTLGKYGITIGGGFKYAADREYVKGPGGSGSVTAAPLRLRVAQTDPAALLSVDFFAAYGLTDICDISADVPIYKDITGWGRVSSSNIGDLEIAAKLRYPYEHPGTFFFQAYYLKLILPTGGNSSGFFPRHSYYITNNSTNSGVNTFTAGAVFFNPMLAWTFDLSSRRVPMLFHANFGGILAKGTKGTAVVAALAMEVRAKPFLTVFTELAGETRVKYYSDTFTTSSFTKDPVRLTTGFRFKLPRSFYCIVAGDIGLTDDQPAYRAEWNRNGYQYSTKAVPKWGGQLIIGWTGRTRVLDRDRDSIPDSLDKCPNQPEDKDGFEDGDGCPDYDNDKDGIADSLDKCPNQPEDRDGFEDADGCPDYDNDKDGIADSLDKCPNWPEDRDGYKDDDGCPDYDNDRDGIPDTLDKCNGRAEDIDGFEDTDGCPDYDNDGDGVADTVDKCPLTAGLVVSNGCPVPVRPKTLIIKRGPLILNSVMFESGEAGLSPVSCVTLDQVATSLMEWSDVKLEIQGHTDLLEANLKLSQQRAEAVRDYLIQKGIASDRLTAVGYGKAQPIAGNISSSGRQKNRRVELHRIN